VLSSKFGGSVGALVHQVFRCVSRGEKVTHFLVVPLSMVLLLRLPSRALSFD